MTRREGFSIAGGTLCQGWKVGQVSSQLYDVVRSRVAPVFFEYHVCEESRPDETAEQYEESLRCLNLVVYMFGERVKNVVDDPIIRPSMKAVSMTYELAHRPEHEDIMTATSHITGKKINRFTHIHQNIDDLIKKSKMGRLLGREQVALFGDGDGVHIRSSGDGLRFLLISGRPLNEPVAWHGPIVMNTQEELELAFEEYRTGTFLKHQGIEV